jgi:hypothetical protein
VSNRQSIFLQRAFEKEMTMAKGRTYNHERISRVDPTTGVSYLQLTSFPTISMNLPYYYTNRTNGFTADSDTLVFRSRRVANAEAPWDIFTVGVDGTRLTQLTERNHEIGGLAVPSATPVVYFHKNGTLWSVDRSTYEEVEISHLEVRPTDEERAVFARLSADDKLYFIPVIDSSGNEVIIRHNTDGSGAKAIANVPDMRLHSVDPAGNGLFVSLREAGTWVLWLVDYDGAPVTRYGTNVFAHQCPLGRTGILQGCALWPHHSLLTLGPGEDAATMLHSGPYYWHSSGSLDGEWIVTDSNWPNEGIFLVNASTRRSGVLLHPHNTGAEAQWTHAHPFFSPDAQHVAFNSDATGTGQICVVKIPEALKERLATQ